MAMHLMVLKPVVVMRYIHKIYSYVKFWAEIGFKLLVIERLSLMLRKVDTSVLGVINFTWFQRHRFNALHIMTCVVTSVLVM